MTVMEINAVNLKLEKHCRVLIYCCVAHAAPCCFCDVVNMKA